MDIQKIKELALANGFSLKQQASGNMDLHSYVYEFAQAIVAETLNQAQLVYGQDGVTTFDTESLDGEISNISSEFEAEYFFDNDDADRLEMLIAKAMRLGELYERQKWQTAKAQAVPEGFVLVLRDPSEKTLVKMSLSVALGEDQHGNSVYLSIDEAKRAYEAMIKAQEPSHD